jgi:hypothetical protein
LLQNPELYTFENAMNIRRNMFTANCRVRCVYLNAEQFETFYNNEYDEIIQIARGGTCNLYSVEAMIDHLKQGNPIMVCGIQFKIRKEELYSG